MNTYLIKDVQIINEGNIVTGSVLIEHNRIKEIGNQLNENGATLIDGTNQVLFPGIIDGQVHFREPGLTHKADLYTETKAAVAGGITSFIDMPNTIPNVLTPEILHEKYRLASKHALANYGFLMGVNGQNLDEVIQMDKTGLLGLSDDGLYFSGKGNLLADHPEILEKLFKHCHAIIAIHSEKEQLIEENEHKYRSIYGDEIPFEYHPLIRSEQACYEATKQAIALANTYKARLHILHLSTEAETRLFRNDIPLKAKNITTEVCIHHLWFSDKDYKQLGPLIKWNPAIKTEKDRQGLMRALLDDRIDMITTDHAPHTLTEKQQSYFKSMSGAPMVQHALPVMLEFYHRGIISLEKIAEKMCHNPAVIYNIKDRGYIREGYFADLTMVNLNKPHTVSRDTILYKCGWSPLEGTTLQSQVTHTFVNGHLVYHNGVFDDRTRGSALETNH